MTQFERTEETISAIYAQNPSCGMCLLATQIHARDLAKKLDAVLSETRRSHLYNSAEDMGCEIRAIVEAQP